MVQSSFSYSYLLSLLVWVVGDQACRIPGPQSTEMYHRSANLSFQWNACVWVRPKLGMLQQNWFPLISSLARWCDSRGLLARSPSFVSWIRPWAYRQWMEKQQLRQLGRLVDFRHQLPSLWCLQHWDSLPVWHLGHITYPLPVASLHW